MKILEMLKTLSEQRVTKGWDVVVKLDKDGAIAFNDESQGIAFCPTKPRKADGVGAGDFFLAGWTSSIISSSASTYAASLKSASAWAGAWVDFCSNEFWADKSLVAKSDVPWPSHMKPRTTSDKEKELTLCEFSLDGRLKSLADIRSYPGIVEGGSLDLAAGRGVTGDFLSVEPEVRSAITAFRDEIENFLGRRRDSRPFNALIAASPGSGKSYLVKEISRELKSDFFEINASQLGTPADVLEKLIVVAGQGSEQAIVLLDEFDTKFGSTHMYPQLLAPLWDGAFIANGVDYRLPRRTVFVLVSSGEPESIEDATKAIASEENKGLDLVTRLNGPALHLKNPSEADRCLMAGSMIRRVLGTFATVERRVFDFLVTSKGLTPRAIEQVIGLIEDSGGNTILWEDIETLAKPKFDASKLGRLGCAEKDFLDSRRKTNSNSLDLVRIVDTDKDEK